MPHGKPWSGWITDKEISLISLQEVQWYMKGLYKKCFWFHVWYHCVPYRCFFRYSTCSPFVDRAIEFHSKWGICRTESWKVSVNIIKIRVGEQLYVQENLHSWASITQMFLCWWLWVLSPFVSPVPALSLQQTGRVYIPPCSCCNCPSFKEDVFNLFLV